MKLRLVSFLLAISMVLTFLPVSAVTAFAADGMSGSCGDNLTYELTISGKNEDDEDMYTLTISGTGEMKDYADDEDRPWENYYENIERIIIGKEITSIGDNAFYACSSLMSVTINGEITSIGDWSFGDCIVLPDITIPNSTTEIGANAFNDCYALTSVKIPDGVTSIGEGAFQASGLTSIVMPSSVGSIGNDAFDCSSLNTVYYTGDLDAWNAIKDKFPDSVQNNIHFVYPVTVKGGTVKVDGNSKAADENGVIVVEKDAEVEVTFDKSTLSDAQVFDQWFIKPDSVLNAVNPKSETISFTMPAEKVTIEAMTREAAIEDDSSILGTAAIIGTAAVGTAVLAYQGYQLGTEFYLISVLPAGAAIPQNYGELTKLVWMEAGKPDPAAVLAADSTDEQKAMTWAVENQLISADKAADASVGRWEVIRTWNQAQKMKG